MADTIRFLGLTEQEADPARAAAAVLPVPFDSAVSWKRGAARAPRAILEASHHVELYDIDTGTEPWEKGIATLEPVAHDGDSVSLAPKVAARVGELLDRNVLPVTLGGDHSISIGAIDAAADRFDDLTVFQIDAHADLRPEYMGSTHSHASVMARARDRCPIVQVGIRSAERAEVESMDPERVFFAHDILRAPDRSWIDRAAERATPNVYVTIDVDAFDPAALPSTGTPEPGGLTWRDVIDVIAALTAKRNVVGFDIVELLPRPERHACPFTVAKLAHRCIAMALANR